MDSEPGGDAGEEVTALIAILHDTGKRLEELTGGEIDSVMDPQGRSFLLQHAQERLRDSESKKKAAILNALPAHIALLDANGTIMSVNSAWQNFAFANGARVGRTDVGQNYLAVCDDARGKDAIEGPTVAAGIRSVLDGTCGSFATEYPCHSPAEQRWFLMTVTPLIAGTAAGAVVMHLDVSDRKRTEIASRDAQFLLDNIVENIPIAIALKSVDQDFRFVKWNKAAESIFGLSHDAAVGRNVHNIWPEPAATVIHDDDLKLVANGGMLDFPDRVMPTQGGGTVHVHLRKVALVDRAGRPTHLLSIVDDISERLRHEAELRRFRAAMDISADAIVLIDPVSLRYIDVNQTLCDFVGRTRDEVLRMTAMELSGESQANIEREHAAIIAEQTSATITVEGTYRRADGALIQVETRRQALQTEAGYIIVVNIRDVTERKKAEDRVRRLSRVYAMLSEINALIVRVEDRNALFQQAGKIAVDAGGFAMAWIGIVDHDAKQIVPVASAGLDTGFMTSNQYIFSLRDEDAATATLAVQAVREKRAVVLNDVTKDSNLFLAKKRLEQGIHSVAFLPLMTSDRVFGVLVLYAREAGFFDDQEMALLKQLAGDIAFAIGHIDKQDRLDYLAFYDVLTGLPNRRLFLERVALHIRIAATSGHKCALFVVDLERFKNINDSLGRAAGDKLLNLVAAWIKQRVVDSSLLARVGADQFAVVLPVVRPDGDLLRFIEAALADFGAQAFRLDDAVLRIGGKIGAAIFPDDGVDADTLFTNAEAALKRAKRTSEPYLFYAQNMTQTVARTLTLENRLRSALDKEEFVLHYQPKINLVSGLLTGAEALIRWNDPQTGLVPPGDFIPILEETGLIYDVGRWALRKAIAQSLRWQAAGLQTVRVAVNVSPLQLRRRDFISEIEHAVGSHPNAAASLEIEITENVIMADIKHSIACLQAIRAMDVKIAIDDFGTGFSSLSYLSKLPVDTLKIDRSFVVEMSDGPDGLALVSTVINLAHAMRLNVVAEGVETEEQSRLLRLLRCDEMQGFLLSKALPAELFKAQFLGSALAPSSTPGARST